MLSASQAGASAPTQFQREGGARPADQAIARSSTPVLGARKSSGRKTTRAAIMLSACTAGSIKSGALVGTE